MKVHATRPPPQHSAGRTDPSPATAPAFAPAPEWQGTRADLPFAREMRERFGHSFADIAVTTGSETLERRGLLAATTPGSVAFASPAPARSTVAHELTHVMQLRNDQQGRGQPVARDGAEREARQRARQPGPVTGRTTERILFDEGDDEPADLAATLGRLTGVSETTWSLLLPLLPQSVLAGLHLAAQLETLRAQATTAKDRFVAQAQARLAGLADATREQLREQGMPDWVLDEALPLLAQITGAVLSALPGVLGELFLDIVAPFWGILFTDLPALWQGAQRAGAALRDLDWREGQAAATEVEQALLSAVGRVELALGVWLLIIGTLAGGAAGGTAGGVGAGVVSAGAAAPAGGAGGAAAGSAAAGGGIYAAMEALGIVLITAQVAADAVSLGTSIAAWMTEPDPDRQASYFNDAILSGIRLGATVLMLLLAFAALRVGQVVGRIAREALSTPAAQRLLPRLGQRLADWLRRLGTPPAGGTQPLNPAHLSELEELLRNDPDRFAARYQEVVEGMTPEQRAAFTRELQGRRFVDAQHYGPARADFESGASTVPPEHRYGEQAFDDWQAAAEGMSSHARSDAPLTQSDVEAAHATAARSLRSDAGQVRGPGDDVLAAGGLGPQGWWSALSPEQLAVLETNPRISLEARGALDEAALTPQQLAARFETAVITYPRGSTVQGHLDDFFRWYRSAEGTMEPAALAAEAQRRFVSLHPFMDGNGRVSRLIMDHALERANLPPPLLRDPNLDFMVSETAWADEVRMGVMETYQTAVRHADGFNAAVRRGDVAEMARRWGTILTLSSQSDRLATWLYGGDE